MKERATNLMDYWSLRSAQNQTSQTENQVIHNPGVSDEDPRPAEGEARPPGKDGTVAP